MLKTVDFAKKKKKKRPIANILRNAKINKNQENRGSKVTFNNQSPKFSDLFDNRFFPKNHKKPRKKSRVKLSQIRSNKSIKRFQQSAENQRKFGLQKKKNWLDNPKNPKPSVLAPKNHFQKNRNLRVETVLKNQEIFELSQKNWYKLDNFQAWV